MKKITKLDHGKVNLRERSHKNLRVRRHLVMRESGAGPNGTESPGGESERIKGQQITTLQMTTKKSRRLEE